jgi:SpoVK/Ycf46/Vps4 family AAA+-type ATPase
MLEPQSDIRKIVQGFVNPVIGSNLNEADYTHISTNYQICKSLLQETTKQSLRGINILIYGTPGSGKTEFAKHIADSINVQMMEISNSHESGAPVPPIRRLRNYHVAQAFFKTQPSVLLFDECEEILGNGADSEREDSVTITPRKSWINKVLENNDIPTIWITNSIRFFDLAYLRRFSLCFEMPLPSQEVREKILDKALSGLISPRVQSIIASHGEVSPAMLTQTAEVIRKIASEKTQRERDDLALHLMNNTLRVQRKKQIDSMEGLDLNGPGFNPKWVNCGVDLSALSMSIQRTRSARICIWGPPGTGKTAFGQWLARKMDVPHLIFKASDLLGSFIGESEKNIARAFETAKQQNALLQLDEVDSFLQERKNASRQWEVTQVNEMLTQMETYPGVLIASTNLFDNIDEASLRRFDLSLRFDFMNSQTAWDMFVQTCEILGIASNDIALKNQISAVKNLTPGDFQQVIRQSRLLPISSDKKLWETIQTTVGMKKQSSLRRTMGFLDLTKTHDN